MNLMRSWLKPSPNGAWAFTLVSLLTSLSVSAATCESFFQDGTGKSSSDSDSTSVLASKRAFDSASQISAFLKPHASDLALSDPSLVDIIFIPGESRGGGSRISSPRYMLALGKTADGKTIEIPTLVDGGVSEDSGRNSSRDRKSVPSLVTLAQVRTIAKTPASGVFVVGRSDGAIFLVGPRTEPTELVFEELDKRMPAQLEIVSLEFKAPPRRGMKPNVTGLPLLHVTRKDGSREEHDLSIAQWTTITTYKKLVAKNQSL